MSSDFAALVSLKQGMDNISLKDLILLPVSHHATEFGVFNERLPFHEA